MKNLEIFPFYHALNLEDKEELKKLLKPYNVLKGTIMHYQGTPCSDSLLLVNGEIRFYTQEESSSDEVTLYKLRAGEQCLSQLMSNVYNTDIIPSVVAETDIEAYIVNREDIEKFITKVPSYQAYMVSLYANKIAEITTVVQNVKFKKLDERIMEYLKAQKQSKIIITHEELAQEMDTSRSVVSRVLKKLEIQKKLHLYRGYIEIIGGKS